jgi:hypothetical protein
MGEHETQGSDDVRGGVEEYFPLDQRFMDETEVVLLEIAQTAVDKLGRGGGRGGGEIAFLAEKNRKAAAGGIASNAATVDATADDGKIENLTQHSAPRAWASQPVTGRR